MVNVPVGPPVSGFGAGAHSTVANQRVTLTITESSPALINIVGESISSPNYTSLTNPRGD